MAGHRSYLFAPGNHPRRIEKALGLPADAVILDLEDAVAKGEKAAARDTALAALQQRPAQGGPAAYIRINGLDTAFAFADLKAVVGPWLAGICLPKAESAAQLHTADWLLRQLEAERGMTPGSLDLLPLIETAAGLAAARAMAAAETRVRRLTFGIADFSQDLGLSSMGDEQELLGIRQELVLASRLGGLEAPVDTVFVNVKDTDGMAASAARAAALGFVGKLCIHPDQIAPANAAFTPDARTVAWAERIVAAFEEAEAQGIASIEVDGDFVDYPVVARARQIIAAAR